MCTKLRNLRKLFNMKPKTRPSVNLSFVVFLNSSSDQIFNTRCPVAAAFNDKLHVLFEGFPVASNDRGKNR